MAITSWPEFTHVDREAREHLVDVLRHSAAITNSDVGYTFLADGEDDVQFASYAEIDRRARAIAARLIARDATGTRALLLFEPGLDYVAAFFGCIYAGVVAVPVYPLDPLRIHRTLPRLEAIINDAQATMLLSTAAILDWVGPLLSRSAHLEELLATDSIDTSDADAWSDPGVEPNWLALLQYTSGSTGAPKGVMLSHANLMHNLARLEDIDRHGISGVSWLPPYHDMGLIGGILFVAYRSRPLVMMSPLSFVQRPIRWLRAIQKYQASCSGGPNFGYELCLKKITDDECEGLDLSPWALAFNGAEPIRESTLNRFYERFAPYGLRRETLFPCYGLAEATLFVSGGDRSRPPKTVEFDTAALNLHRVLPADDSTVKTARLVSSGHPYADQDLRIVDPDTCRQCDDDTIGEIWLASDSVGHGYWNRHEESKHTFGAHLADSGEGPFLRTGDLGFLFDGDLFITGRQKDLIIAAGRNHYPQDIEATAQSVDAALKADGGAAIAVDDGEHERVILIQEVLRPKRQNLDALVTAIRNEVALVHEIQLAEVVLIKPATLAKTSSGKIQRSACRRQYLEDRLAVAHHWSADAQEAVATPARHVEPETPTERRLADVWCNVLDITSVSRHDDFFDVGGHSLLATQLMTRIRAEWSIDLPLKAIFEAPTLAQLAARIDTCERSRALPPVARVPRDADLELSSAQQRLWFLDQLEPDQAWYNLSVTARIGGPLNRSALSQALRSTVARHESLRTTFPVEAGTPRQHIVNDAEIELVTVSLVDTDANGREDLLRDQIQVDARTPFDLACGPLLRATLYVLRDDCHVLQLTMHHIISDGWSMGVLLDQMSADYAAFAAGVESIIPAPSIGYPDYAAWQKNWVAGEEIDKQLAYWHEQLDADVEPLALPTDTPRPATPSYRGDVVRFEIPAETTDALKRLAADHDGTLYMTLLAAYQSWLSRYTGQDQIRVGTPVANRRRPEFESLIGFFVNTLIMHGDLSGDPTFAHVIDRARQTALAAFAHQDVPFEKLVEQLAPTRSRSHAPLFQTALVLQNTRLQPPTPGEITVDVDEIHNGTAKQDLALYLREKGDVLEAVLEYSTDLFATATAERMAQSFLALVTAVVNDPSTPVSRLPLIDSTVSSVILDGGPSRDADRTLIDLIAEQVDRTPAATAITDGRRSLTYAELDQKTNRLADALRRRGVASGHLVAVYCDRSMEAVVSLLAVLKAGASYLPLDVAYPAPRVEFMLADAKPALVLTTQDHRASLPRCDAQVLCVDAPPSRRDGVASSFHSVHPDSDDLAYVIYTSGSTGAPKGVAVAHRAISNHALALGDAMQLAPGDRMLQIISLSFDAAAEEIFPTLISGAELVLYPTTADHSGSRLLDFAHHERISHLHLPTALWTDAVAAAENRNADSLPNLKTVLVGGESVAPDQLAAWRRCLGEHCFLHAYGVTEAAVTSTLYEPEPLVPGALKQLPIGRPIAGTQVFILDGNQNLLPAGVVGELYIGGVGLAREYRNQSALTAERFVEISLPDGSVRRAYRTGDRVRLRGDGHLDFLGRADHQLKVRGWRIEPGEVEQAIHTHPDVCSAAVVARRGPAGAELVAYVVPAAGAQLNGNLRRYLRDRLPEPMVPSRTITLDQLPLAPGGKTDYRALADMAANHRAAPRTVTPPHTETERRLAPIWQRLLEVPEVGVEDDFFDLGGHSMLAVQLMAEIEQTFGKRMSVASLFHHPTLRELSEKLDRDDDDPGSILVPLETQGDARPLFVVHPAGGTVFCYVELAKRLAPNQPVYGIQARGLHDDRLPHDDVDSMAADYVEALREQQPTGPYRLAGWSIGGNLAVEMARRLHELGEQVELLAVFDAGAIEPGRQAGEEDFLGVMRDMFPGESHPTIDEFRGMSLDEQRDYFLSRAARAHLVPTQAAGGHGQRMFEVFLANLKAMFEHPVRPYPGHITLIRAAEHHDAVAAADDLGWRSVAAAGVEVHEIPGTHLDILTMPNVERLADTLADCLARIDAGKPARCD